MSNIKTLTYPQVAILWWNESKTSRPTYFEASSFHDLINGQLVLVVGQSEDHLGGKDFKILISNYSLERGFYAHPDNLIFLGKTEMNGIKPSHYRTPRTLQECTFQSGYKGGISADQEEEERTKSWILLLSVFLFLSVLLSFSLS